MSLGGGIELPFPYQGRWCATLQKRRFLSKVDLSTDSHTYSKNVEYIWYQDNSWELIV